ncbi:hypothetical protein ACJW30_05G187100 [Castanea mollissima]
MDKFPIEAEEEKCFPSRTRSTAFLLLLFGVFSLTRAINSQIIYDYSICLDQSNETSNTSYNSNLTESSNVGLYALFLCRGNVSHGTCQTCVSYAIGNITTLCPSNKSAIIWYDQCLLRYSDVNFFGQAQILPMVLMWNYENTSSPDLPNFYALGLMYYLINRTKIVTLSNGSKTSYGLVQCTADLMKTTNSCCQTQIGWLILGPSCHLRYESYSFIEQSTAIQTVNDKTSKTTTMTKEHAGGGGKKTTKTIIITVSSIASIVVVATLLGFWFYTSSGRRKQEEDSPMHAKGCDEDTGEMHYFNLSTILTATNNFFDVNKLGEGGFGPIYMCLPILCDKRLSIRSKQVLEEFKTKNLVRLLGCCLEGNEKLLVYEYMANTSLDAFLFENPLPHYYNAKHTNTINGIAKGLQYLHEDSRLKIIHRDMKASNVLLDDEMNPKTSNFGTARIFGGNQIEASTNYRIVAPVYAMERLYSIKSDVYSFGILTLEIVSGKKNNGFYHPERAQSLLLYAWRLRNEGKGMEFIDQTIVDICPISEALRLIHIALIRVQKDPNDRKSIKLPQPLAPPFSVARFIMFDQSSSNEMGIRFITPDQSSTSASR